MVRIEGGTFWMGSPAKEKGRALAEQRHKVMVNDFAIGKYVVTFAEYDCFCEATKRKKPRDPGASCRATGPAINVDWNDAVAYAEWLSDETRKDYRLPTEAEWEYAARAGTETAYWWGDEARRGDTAMANCDGCGSEWDCRQTAPVGLFEANAFGLHDMHGNVWEWMEDCWHGSYKNAPVDGRAWLDTGGGDCRLRVLRGGSWNFVPQFMRSASRYRTVAGSSSYVVGFRLAQDL